MTELYAALLNLHGRRCVVVGGGQVAERKVRPLLEAGATVTVVAPAVTAAIDAAARAGEIVLRRRPFQKDDLDGAFLTFAATDVAAVNAAVVREARRVGALVNAATEPRLGDFQVPATLRRGDVVVSLSTGGRSPGFARRLRAELESWLTPERIDLLDLMADVRRELKARGDNPPPESWRRAIGDDVVDALRRGDGPAARALLLHALGGPTPVGG